MKPIHRENRENRVSSYRETERDRERERERERGCGCELSQLQTESVSHVTSDEAIVPFRRLNSYEERNLRSAVEVAALVNGRAPAFCAARGEIFLPLSPSPPRRDRRDDRRPPSTEGLLCNSVESSLLESTASRMDERIFATKEKKERATSNDRSIYPKLATRRIYAGFWTIYRMKCQVKIRRIRVVRRYLGSIVREKVSTLNCCKVAIFPRKSVISLYGRIIKFEPTFTLRLEILMVSSMENSRSTRSIYTITILITIASRC